MLYGKKLIYIIDDEEDICTIMKDQLELSFPNVIVKTFYDPKYLLSDSNLLDVDLYIIDIILGTVDGRDICNHIVELGSNVPVLFVSGHIVTDDFFTSTSKCYATDFIEKPYKSAVFINRVTVLLSLSDLYRRLEIKIKEEESKVKFRERMVWDVFNHSYFYVVVINNDYTIRLANYRLAHDLGFDSEDDMIGESCFEFIPENQKDLVEIIRGQVIDKRATAHEVTVDMKTLSGETILVRWFNSYVNGGNDFSFSIGIPVQLPRYGDSVDSIRDYFNTILDKDREMIGAMKEVVLAQETINS